jgi:hypothetical protein
MRMISDDSLFTIVLFVCEKRRVHLQASESLRQRNLSYLIPDEGNREAAVVVGVRAQVQILDMFRAEERVGLRTGKRVDRGERPPVGAHFRRDDCNSYSVSVYRLNRDETRLEAYE